jgi:hypothetical protein
MAEVSLLDYAELRVNTAACEAYLSYAIISGYDCIRADIFDNRLHESFKITALASRYSSSRKKLENIINNGVSDEDVEFLRLIQQIYREITRAKYFEKFADNILTMKELEKAVKLSTANKFHEYTYLERKNIIESKFTQVCNFDIYHHWYSVKMMYAKEGDYHFVIMVDRNDLDIQYAVIFNDFGAKIIKCKRKIQVYVEYAIYAYLTDGRTDLFNKWLKKGSEDFSEIFRLLDKNEKEGTLTIYDRELYDFIKSAITMYAIA